MVEVNKASLVAQTVKCLPAMQETRVRSLGWEDHLEREMATHSITLAWKLPCTEEPTVGYSPWGQKESDTTERLHSLNEDNGDLHQNVQCTHFCIQCP